MATNVHHPQNIANAFVTQYYMILNRSPEIAHKFYGESSQLCWAESDGEITPVATLTGINEKILSSDYKNCLTEVKTVDAQKSHDGGVIVGVTGSLVDKDGVTKKFFQTFFLAQQDKGFFVLNDILRVFDASGSIIDVAANGSTEQSSDESSIVGSPTSSPAKEADESAKAADVKPSSCTSSTASGEKEPPVVAPASNVEVVPAVQPALNADVLAAVAPSSNAGVSPSVPASNADVLPVVGPASHVATKISYASVVAKAIRVTSPRSPKTGPKPSAPLPNGAPKALAPLRNGTPKAPAPLPNSSPKAPAPLPNGSPKAPAPLPSGSPKAPAPLPSGSPKALAPLPNSSPKALAPLPNGSPKAPVPLPNGTPTAPAPLPNGAPTAPAPLPNGAPTAPAPLPNGAPKAPTPGNHVWKAIASSRKFAPKLPTRGNGAPDTSAHADTRGIYIGRLPYDITKQGVADVLKQFGHLRRHSDSVQIRRYEDGFCCGFAEFESPDSALRAVEVHHVKFGEKEAYIAYKKSTYGRGGSRSPTRGVSRNGNEARPNYDRGQARGFQQGRFSGQGSR